MQEAPGHFAYDHDHHCYVCRQPQSASEITDMIGKAWMAELQSVRYAAVITRFSDGSQNSTCVTSAIQESLT